MFKPSRCNCGSTLRPLPVPSSGMRYQHRYSTILLHIYSELISPAIQMSVYGTPRPKLTAEHFVNVDGKEYRENVTHNVDEMNIEDVSDVSLSPKYEPVPDGMTTFSYGVLLPGPVMDNKGILTDEEFGIATLVQEAGQDHLMRNWDMPGVNDDKKREFLEQVKYLHKYCTGEGGIMGYAERAKKLLAESAEGLNPLEGWTASVPEGMSLCPGSEEYSELENLGVSEISKCGFVLVAGGLGERLGYSDIKLKLPTELCTNTSYLEFYCNRIKAFQRKSGSGREIPLAIMVSDDTMSKTEEELIANNYFGLKKEQITLIKQEKVPALKDNEGHFVLDPDDKYKILTKPHGHGDVHSLMHIHGIAKKWLESGIKWCVFMQDTNALCFNSLDAVLGVSIKLNLEVNSIAIPRKAKQAIGGISKLTNKEGKVMTINVEYNQLDPLLRSAGGDGDTNDPSTGYSPYPGNINQLVFAMEPYCEVLAHNGGYLNEFVNPKYTDSTRSAFKKPTRLECMMQDYPRLLSPEAKVGFTSMEPWFCFSPVKNSLADALIAQSKGTPPASASSGEADMYGIWSKMLNILGCKVAAAPEKSFAGIKVSLGPCIVIEPDIAVTFQDLKKMILNPPAVTISERSALIIKGSGTVLIESLNLDGALVLQAEERSTLRIKNLSVCNSGWMFKPLEDGDDSSPEVLRMRGYRLHKETRCNVTARAGETEKVIDRSDVADDEEL